MGLKDGVVCAVTCAKMLRNGLVTQKAEHFATGWEITNFTRPAVFQRVI